MVLGGRPPGRVGHRQTGVFLFPKKISRESAVTVTIGPFRLSPEFFTKTRWVNRCREACANLCCDEGVYLTLYDAQNVIQHAEEIQPYLVEPYDFSQWDISHPAFISTPVLNEGAPHQHCWFFTRGQRCALHSLALEKNLPVRSIKPFFCLLFPLTLVDIDVNVTELAVDTKAYETCLVEGIEQTYLYQQFEPDLRRVLGDAGYEELTRLFRI